MLEGVLLDLVPFGKEFEDNMPGWMNGPMREWWTMDTLITRAMQERHIERIREAPPGQRAQNVRFGMRTKDGVPIGLYSLMHIDPTHRQAEVGAGIGDPDYWGGGFGSDAMLLITAYAFEWLGLRRLYLNTLDTNLRAQRQVEKCGFSRESRRRALMFWNGEWHDWLVYGLLREEWPGYAPMVERLGLRAKAEARGYL